MTCEELSGASDSLFDVRTGPNTPNNTALCPAVFGTARRQLLECVSVSIAVRASAFHVFRQGDLGIDTCTYNGFKVDYDNWYYGPRPTEGYIQSGVDGCENP